MALSFVTTPETLSFLGDGHSHAWAVNVLGVSTYFC